MEGEDKKDKNTKTLRDKGLLGTDLPQAYEDFIDGLTPEIIEELVTLKKTLEDHDIEVEPIRLKDKGTTAVPSKSMPVL